MLLDLQAERIDRVSLAGNRLLCEHFAANQYPQGPPMNIGIGEPAND